jgi:cell division protein FtsN
MNYEFSLNKTAVISITAGCLVIGVLLFAAGLVVGSQWLIGGASAEETTAKNNEPVLPQEPVLNDEKIPAAKSPAAPKTTVPTAPKQPSAVTPPLEETAQAALPPAAANGEIKIIHEEAAEASTGENAASEPDYVTVQIGVFLDEKEADRLLKDIERKGYAPSFFSGRDAEARQWYAVRIGAYSDKQQAANAAANFSRQEKLKAVVRPLGSL